MINYDGISRSNTLILRVSSQVSVCDQLCSDPDRLTGFQAELKLGAIHIVQIGWTNVFYGTENWQSLSKKLSSRGAEEIYLSFLPLAKALLAPLTTDDYKAANFVSE